MICDITNSMEANRGPIISVFIYSGFLDERRFHFQFLCCHNVQMVSLGLGTKTFAVALKNFSLKFSCGFALNTMLKCSLELKMCDE